MLIVLELLMLVDLKNTPAFLFRLLGVVSSPVSLAN